MGKDHELLEAARTGNLSVVEKLIFSKSKSSSFAASFGIRVGANINCQDQNGYTPLHHASLNGHCPIVQALLEAGASVNVSDYKGSCPLHLAAWNGKAEIVKTILTTGPNFASVNQQNGDKETALHCAAQHGHLDSVKILLDSQADAQIRNIRNESALDLASQYGRLEVVRLNSFPPSPHSLIRNIRSESALDLASQYGRLEVVRLLLTYYPKLLAHSPERFTSLHLASRNGHRGVVELLLVHGADINKVGANGTALHEAALFGKYDVVSLLLKRGAETGSKDSSGRTALELVSQLDTQISRDIAKLIVARIQDGEDYEPLRSIISSAPRKKDMKAKNQFDQPTNVFVSGAKVSRNLSRSFGEADVASMDPSRERPSIATSFRYSRASQLTPDTSKSPSGHRLKHSFLRRSSSARSARSLPRMASSASFHGNRSLHSLSVHRKKSHDTLSIQDWSIRQHHPSIDMFPVTPTRPSQGSRRTSVSEPSSPQLGAAFVSPIHINDSPKLHVRESPFRMDDDCVFYPGTPTSGRPSFETFLSPRHEPKAVIPLKPPADDNTSTPSPPKSSKIISIIVKQPTMEDQLSPSENELSAISQIEIPPPLPEKASSSPPCGIDLHSPPILSENTPPFPVKPSDINSLSADKGNSNVSGGKEIAPIVPRGHGHQSERSSSSMSFEGHHQVEAIVLNSSLSSSSDISPTVKSPGAPRKPQRHKPVLMPPPLPPKPAHMMQDAKKSRPPPPVNPPPTDDEDIFDEDDVMSDDTNDDQSSSNTVAGAFRQNTESTSTSPPPPSTTHSSSTSSTIVNLPSPTDTITSNTSEKTVSFEKGSEALNPTLSDHKQAAKLLSDSVTHTKLAPGCSSGFSTQPAMPLEGAINISATDRDTHSAAASKGQDPNDNVLTSLTESFMPLEGATHISATDQYAHSAAASKDPKDNILTSFAPVSTPLVKPLEGATNISATDQDAHSAAASKDPKDNILTSFAPVSTQLVKPLEGATNISTTNQDAHSAAASKDPNDNILTSLTAFQIPTPSDTKKDIGIPSSKMQNTASPAPSRPSDDTSKNIPVISVDVYPKLGPGSAAKSKPKPREFQNPFASCPTISTEAGPPLDFHTSGTKDSKMYGALASNAMDDRLPEALPGFPNPSPVGDKQHPKAVSMSHGRTPIGGSMGTKAMTGQTLGGDKEHPKPINMSQADLPTQHQHKGASDLLQKSAYQALDGTKETQSETRKERNASQAVVRVDVHTVLPNDPISAKPVSETSKNPLSPTLQCPSPPFSPPSPNTAMLQVSSALQKTDCTVQPGHAAGEVFH